jgi:hypothetical protein
MIRIKDDFGFVFWRNRATCFGLPANEKESPFQVGRESWNGFLVRQFLALSRCGFGPDGGQGFQELPGGTLRGKE